MNANPIRTRAHLVALQRFAIAITVLNILGHLVLGFEQAWIHPFIALATTYGTEMLLECVGCFFTRRSPRFIGSFSRLVMFLLPAHISGLAVAMLLYPNKNFIVIAFAAAVAIGSKALFRVPVGKGRSCHFLNPSNFGITATLLIFPWVGVVPPYHFTENIPMYLFWLLPLLITCTGTLVNMKLTRRHPLILGWLGGFVLQAWIRSLPLGGAGPDTTFLAALAPMSGVAFILFTFYMVTDPMTSPERYLPQIGFGLGVALVYGVIVASRGVFAMFFALTFVCVIRGVFLGLVSLLRRYPITRPSRETLDTDIPNPASEEVVLMHSGNGRIEGQPAME